jgi:protein-S-isoprenylcysteine O-methyltransferase Ste14
MINSHILLALGWIVYCVLHSVLASSKFKRLAYEKMGSQYKLYRLYYTVFAFAGFALILFYQITIDSYRIFIPTKISLVIGIIIALSGLAIMSICILKYFMQLSGLKGLIENRTSNELMITGIHKIVRHPLYTGTFIFIWGLLVIFPVAILLIADTIITIYTLIGLRFEEMKLEKEFGEAYKSYKRNVPMLIPKLKVIS